jgi:hypothetical protein
VVALEEGVAQQGVTTGAGGFGGLGIPANEIEAKLSAEKGTAKYTNRRFMRNLDINDDWMNDAKRFNLLPIWYYQAGNTRSVSIHIASSC